MVKFLVLDKTWYVLCFVFCVLVFFLTATFLQIYTQYGQIGDGTYNNNKYYSSATQLFGNGTHFASEIACGGQHSIILSIYTHVYVFGSDARGQLGNGYPFQNLATPYRMSLNFCFDKASNDPMVCSGKGTCTSDDTCVCSSGYTTTNCSLAVCFGKYGSDACSGKGTCVSPNQCQCVSTHYGQECSITKCFTVPSSDPSTCSSHGSCLDYDVCKCSDNWTGLKCTCVVAIVFFYSVFDQNH